MILNSVEQAADEIPEHNFCMMSWDGRVYLGEFPKHGEVIALTREVAEHLDTSVTIRCCGEDVRMITPRDVVIAD